MLFAISHKLDFLMFTGLIEDVGQVHSWTKRKGSGVLTIKTKLPSEELDLGSSIAVNGACLTVIDNRGGRFAVDLSPETLERTNFKGIRPGDELNLERPLRLSDRLGGHLVTGHVDGVGVVERIKKKDKFIFIWFKIPEALSPLLVSKGSVAVDGISLTVNECEGRLFSVAIIPFTSKHTNLRRRRVGDKVNLETDLLGKYVQRLLVSGRIDGGAIYADG